MRQFLILLHIFLLIGSSHEVDEECLVKDTFTHYITKEESIPITTFMTEENYITLNLAFENKNEALDTDYINVKWKSYQVTKIRKIEGDNTKSANLTSPVPFGWINMNITVNKQEVYISPYVHKYVADFPLRQIIIASKNMTSCKKGTPTWIVERYQPVTLPLNGLSTSRISLNSSREFSPVFSILGCSYYLSYQSGVILGPSGSKLPGNTYSFLIENDNNSITLTHENDGCGTQIYFLKHETILTSIIASTLDEDFILTLEPTVHQIKACSNISVSVTSQDKDHFTPIIVLSILLIFTIFIGVLVMIFFRKKIKNNEKHHEEEKEEKDALIKDSNQAKDKNIEELQSKVTVLKSEINGLKIEAEKKDKEASEKLRRETNRLKIEADEKEKKANEKLQSEINGLKMEAEKKDKEASEKDLVKWVEEEDVAAVQRTLSAGCNPNMVMAWGKYKAAPILCYAIVHENDGLFRAILEAGGIDPNLRGDFPNTPLMEASLRGNAPIVELLLANGADPNIVSGNPLWPPLFSAAVNGNLTICQHLLNKGAEVNATGGKYGWNCLFWSAQKGHLDVAKLLVKHGADPHMKSKNGNTAAVAARDWGHTAFADWLEKQ